MPRFFKPRDGFPTAPNAKAVRIGDDGDAHLILADGAEERTGYVGSDSRWMPNYTVGEMENLIRGGTWVEVESADADPGERPMSPAAAPIPQQSHAAGPVTSAPSPVSPAKPPVNAGPGPQQPADGAAKPAGPVAQ